MDGWPAHLTCSAVDGDPGVLRLVVKGEVDLASAPVMRRFADDLLDARPVGDVLVVDLSEVDFLSAAGLHALVGMAMAGRDRGVRVDLGPATELVERVLTVSGVRREIESVSLPATAGDATLGGPG